MTSTTVDSYSDALPCASRRAEADGAIVVFATRPAAMLVIVAIAFVLGAACATGQAARATFPGRNGAIVFSSVRSDGASEIYAMRQDGKAQHRLTLTDPLGRQPAWSPNGRTLVFVATTEGGELGQLWLMRSNGTRRHLILQRRSIRSPEVSRDGREIAFAVARAICVVWIDGHHERCLSRPPRGFFDDSPTWSPDGSKIAFARKSTQFARAGAIHVVSVRGGSAHRLIQLPGGFGNPSQVRWAATGRLGYTELRAGFARIYTVNARGRDRRVVVKKPIERHGVESFAWSRDGSRIAFLESDVAQQIETIYIVGANGRGRRSVAVLHGRAAALSWSSRGAIAYDDGDGSLWTVAPGGNRRRMLHGGSDRYPAFTADGHQIGFASHDGFDVMTTNGSDRRTLVPGTAFGPASWSPDTSHIALTAFGVTIIDVASGAQSYFDSIPGVGSAPAWSPAGTTVAFANVHDYSGVYYSEIAIGDPTTGAASTLYSTREFATDPDWSPDGTRLAFSLFRVKQNAELGTGAVYILDRDGLAHEVIANASDPAWSPDGSKIVFVRTVRGNTDIYVANADGSAVRRLTSNPGVDRDPAWQPASAFDAARSPKQVRAASHDPLWTNRVASKRSVCAPDPVGRACAAVNKTAAVVLRFGTTVSPGLATSVA